MKQNLSSLLKIKSKLISLHRSFNPSKKIWLGFGCFISILFIGFFLMSHYPYVEASGQGSLMDYWKFDETSAGSTIIDSSGNGNNATPINSPTPSTSVPTTSFSDSNSLSFNGSQYATVPNSPSDNLNGSFTISFWVNPTSWDNTNSSGIISKKVDNGSTQPGFVIYDDGSTSCPTGTSCQPYMNMRISDVNGNSYPYLYSASPVTVGTWQQWTAVYNSSTQTFTWYKNGVSDKVWTGIVLGDMTNSNPLDIGYSQDWNGYYSGKMDDMRIYNRALSSTEVAQLGTGNNTSSIWTGGSSRLWTDPSNWSTGAVPDAFTNITIGNGTYQPVLYNATGSANLTIDSNDSLNLNGSNLTINSGGSFTNSGTLLLDGNETLNGFTNDTANGGTVSYSGSGSYSSLNAGNNYANLQFGGSGSYTLASPLVINSNLDIGSGSLNGSFDNITVDGNMTLENGSYSGGLNLTVNGNFVDTAINNSFTEPNGSMTVNGNFTYDSTNGGSYNSGTRTINFSGGNQTISANGITFYGLLKEASAAGQSLVFTSGSTVNVAGSLILDGQNGGNLAIQSTSNGNPFTINMTGPSSYLYTPNDITLSDSTITTSNGSSVVLPANPSNSINGGDNSGWFDVAPSLPSNLGPTTETSGIWISNKNPNLQFSLSDPNVGQNVKYEIQISSNSSFSSNVVDYTSALASQGNVSFTVGQATGSGSYARGYPGQTLVDGTYYWRVMTIDSGNLSSSYVDANNGSIAFKVDSTPPTPVSTPFTLSPTDNTQPTWSWSASTDTGSGLATPAYTVEWSQNSSFSTNVISSTSSTINFTQPNILTDGTWYFRVKATDYVGNVSAWSPTGSVIIDTTPPNLINITANNISDSSDSIQWSTSTAASSTVNYGPTNNYGSSTNIINTNPYVTSHSVTLSGLEPCTLYHYDTTSTDALGNSSTSGDNYFITNGCAGSANVTSHSDSNITDATGGFVSLGDITLNVPVNYATNNADFQIKQLDNKAVSSATGVPAGFTQVGDNFYDIEAVQNSISLISSFNRPLNVTFSYLTSEVSGMVTQSLTIYRWDQGLGWTPLSNCSVNTDNQSVACTTNGFSVFALFGTTEPQTQTSSTLTPTNNTTNTTKPYVNTAPQASSSNNHLPTTYFQNSKITKSNNNKTLSTKNLWILIVILIAAFWFIIAFKRRKKKQED